MIMQVGQRPSVRSNYAKEQSFASKVGPTSLAHHSKLLV